MAVLLETFFNPIFPVFAIMLVGIVLAKCSLFDVSSAQALNKFVFYVAVPALLFKLVSTADFANVDWRMPLLYFLSESVLFFLGTLVGRYLFKRSTAEALLLGMTACFVNHVFFILPIAAIIYGQKAVELITAVIVIDTTVVFGGLIVGLEIANHREAPVVEICKRLACNPVLIAIALGFCVNFGGVPVHEGIRTYTSFVGAAAAPTSLFCLGIILSASWKRTLDSAALGVTFLKIIVMPVVVWTVALCFGTFQPVVHDALLITAAGPSGAMPFVLALQYRVCPDSIGLTILYSTVFSLLTLTLIT